MPEVSLTVLIIAAAAALLVGFGAAYLIQNAKLAPLKAERDLAKREQQSAAEAASAALQKCDSLAEALTETREQLARRDSDIRNISANLYDANQKKTELENENRNLNTMLSMAKAEKAAAEESNRQLKEWIEKSKEEMKDSFASLSKGIAENNSKVFLESANDKLGDFAKTLGENLKGNNEAVGGIVKRGGSPVLHF